MPHGVIWRQLYGNTWTGAVSWEHNRHLFAVAVVATLTAVGLTARRRRWPRWMAWHGAAMAGAFIALRTGFYVDNGPQIPVWNRLPSWPSGCCPPRSVCPDLAGADPQRSGPAAAATARPRCALTRAEAPPKV